METILFLDDEANGVTQMEVIPQGLDLQGISFMTVNGSVLLKKDQLLLLASLITRYLIQIEE